MSIITVLIQYDLSKIGGNITHLTTLWKYIGVIVYMSHCNLIAPCYFRLSIFRIVFCHSPYGRRVQCVVAPIGSAPMTSRFELSIIFIIGRTISSSHRDAGRYWCITQQDRAEPPSLCTFPIRLLGLAQDCHHHYVLRFP